MRGLLRAAVCVVWPCCIVAPAGAAEKLRVGKAVAFAWTFTPLDVGIQAGIFAKHGLDDRSLGRGRRRQDAAGADRRQHRHRHRQRARHGLHGQGRPGQGGGRHVRRAEEHGGDGRLQLADQDGRRPQGQEARLHHRGLADPLDRRPDQPRSKAGARPASPWCRSAACRRRARRSRPARSTATSARWKPATRSKSRRNGASSPAPRRSSSISSPMCSSRARS